MRRTLEERAAIRVAEDVINELKITALPIDPFGIARVKDIHVEGSDEIDNGFSGALVRAGNQFGILYSNRVRSVGFANFTVAHELGHYFIPGHIEVVLPDGNGIHRSRSGFVSSEPIERQADLFAANLLMPEPLFTKAMAGLGLGIESLKNLAATCCTSLTATAIRFAEHTSEIFAVILSNGQKIDWCFMSDSLKDIPDLEWIQKGTSLPADSATAILNRDPANVSKCASEESCGSIGDWFGCDHSYELNEDALGLGSSGKTLTILFSDEPFEPDEEDGDDDD